MIEKISYFRRGFFALYFAAVAAGHGFDDGNGAFFRAGGDFCSAVGIVSFICVCFYSLETISSFGAAARI